ncbi:DMT family transporter [Paucibacter sp. APW11]|uniref:DMT family transporter n=1 Tax=Roseateles aquae TaxID=3077235 RepID=A0ABU3P6K5_9BURK|nr:DMT family transporter [Paucibacter sp. APW11]MDT8997912.1 DMT family transporter [Paucibacter sp. APW11]
MAMTHRKAVVLMLLVTLMWSSAGVVTRQLEAARSFEVTFWRSAFNALSLLAALLVLRGPALWGQVLRAPRKVWASGLCWAVMYTAFMLALTMTSVANVLVTMALGPLLTALFARIFLHHRLPARTWLAIALGSAGIAWMFAHEMQGGPGSLAGMGVALGVPLAAACNWTLLQHDSRAGGERSDMLLAVLLGALVSALLTLPLAWPLQASAHDVGLLAGLGLFQLALPCLLVVRLSQVLSGPELALLGLLEVLFGVLWAWLGAGEAPSTAALSGGAMVLTALVGNELLGLRRSGVSRRE